MDYHKKNVAVQARIELGFDRFLQEKNYQAIVTHFGDLGALKPLPDLYTGAEAWILAGGAHHTAFSYDITTEQMFDWASMMGIEAVVIDDKTTIPSFKKDLMLGEIFYRN